MHVLMQAKNNNYKCIGNVDEVKKFGEMILKSLSNLKTDNVLLVQPISRRKYDDTIPNSSIILPRAILNSDSVDDFIKCLTRYEVPKEHSYTMTMKDGTLKSIPEKSLVYYITLNPKSYMMGLIKLQSQISERMYKMSIGEEVGNFPNIDTCLKSHIHKSTVKCHFIDIDLDVDHSNLELQRKVKNLFDEIKIWPTILTTLFTRGGFHIILHNDKLTGHQHKSLFLFSQKNFFTLDKDSQVPIPGTYQSDHLVHMIDLEDYWRSLLVI